MARTKGSKTHCSHCGGEGHTVRTCTAAGGQGTIKKHRKTKVKKPRKVKDWSNTYCRYCGGIGHNPATCDCKPERRKVTCSFCKEKGHTRRTCPEMPAYKDFYIKANAAFKQRVKKAVEDQGLGKGAVVNYTLPVYMRDPQSMRGYYVDKTYTCLVVDHDFSTINVCAIISEYARTWGDKYDWRAMVKDDDIARKIANRVSRAGMRTNHRNCPGFIKLMVIGGRGKDEKDQVLNYGRGSFKGSTQGGVITTFLPQRLEHYCDSDCADVQNSQKINTQIACNVIDVVLPYNHVDVDEQDLSGDDESVEVLFSGKNR